MTHRRWVVVAVALLVLVAGGLAVVLWPERDLPPGCDFALEARDRLAADPLTSGDRTISVLGDSYTQGGGLPGGPEVAWPTALGERLGAEVVVDGVGSTGFTTRGFCVDVPVTYGERLDADPPEADIVIVQGGVNDALNGRPDDVAAAATDLLEELEDVPTVVVVGPPPVPLADASAITTVDAALRQATDEAGRVYVPLLDADIELLDDLVHPTGPGQQRIAELVAAAIATAGPPR